MDLLEFGHQFALKNSVEGRTEVQEEHSAVSTRFVKVLQGSMEGKADGVLCRPIGSLGELILVKSDWDGLLNYAKINLSNDVTVTRVSAIGRLAAHSSLFFGIGTLVVALSHVGTIPEIRERFKTLSSDLTSVSAVFLLFFVCFIYCLQS